MKTREARALGAEIAQRVKDNEIEAAYVRLAPVLAERTLLAFLEPMFEEWEMAAAKGVGWGLKTLGRYYPDLLVAWLPRQLSRRHRAVIERKALTYLSEAQTRRVLKGVA
jgi:hypothetical protein